MWEASHPRVALVASTTGELLLTQVGSRGWDVPGGHLEPGESPLQAATRKLVEEAGLVGQLSRAGAGRVRATARWCCSASGLPLPAPKQLHGRLDDDNAPDRGGYSARVPVRGRGVVLSGAGR